MRFVRANERSRIADLGGLAVHPDFRGGKVADTAARLFRRHLFDDLGFRMDAWRFALLFAASIGLLGFAGGWIVEGDPGSGVVRGGFEGLAVLLCFVTLGRRLALRR